MCEGDDVNEFVPYSEPDNKSGEFQFLKLRNCNGHRKTVILENVYRLPAASNIHSFNRPEKFNNLFDKILQKLNTNRYSNKIKYIVGDINQDLIKYDSETDCQNLIDNAHNNGFVQIVSQPVRTSTFCDGQVHVKCWNNGFGCTACCESIFPGFHAYT